METRWRKERRKARGFNTSLVPRTDFSQHMTQALLVLQGHVTYPVHNYLTLNSTDGWWMLTAGNHNSDNFNDYQTINLQLSIDLQYISHKDTCHNKFRGSEACWQLYRAVNEMDKRKLHSFQMTVVGTNSWSKIVKTTAVVIPLF